MIVNGETSTKNAKNSRAMKITAFFYLILVAASLLLVHSPFYGPAVSYVLLYMVVAVLVTISIATIMLPPEQFSSGFVAGISLAYAAMLSLATFFSGGSSSELFLLLLPLLLCCTLHGLRGVGIVTLVGSLFFYGLCVLPDFIGSGLNSESIPVILYRFGLLLTVGLFALFSLRMRGAKSLSSSDDESGRAPAEDVSTLLRRADREIQAKRGVPVAVVIVDPGQDVEDIDLLLERVEARISRPVLLGEDDIFGLVVAGGDREIESAARRSLAAASSLGSTDTRVGAAVYPRDARSAKELLSAAGQALEAAFEIDSPTAMVLSGRASRPSSQGERPYRAAR
ncbi:MAG: hypothetical protein ACR2KW_01510 [Rubrobacter sp.]